MASSNPKLEKLQPQKKKLNGSPTQKVLLPLAAKIDSKIILI